MAWKRSSVRSRIARSSAGRASHATRRSRPSITITPEAHDVNDGQAGPSGEQQEGIQPIRTMLVVASPLPSVRNIASIQQLAKFVGLEVFGLWLLLLARLDELSRVVFHPAAQPAELEEAAQTRDLAIPSRGDPGWL